MKGHNKFAMVAALSLGLASAVARAADGQMVYGETTRLDTFDPYTVHEASGQRLTDLIFDSLVELNPGGQYVGLLAKSWEVKNGGTGISTTLTSDAFWKLIECMTEGRRLVITGDEMRKFIDQDVAKWKKVVEFAGIQNQN